MIIDVGIAHGGSLLLNAANLTFNKPVREDKKKKNGAWYRYFLKRKTKKIVKDSLYKYIKIIEGSSVSEETKIKVLKYTQNKKKILVILDSNHSHDQGVLKELEFYSKFVSKGSYCIVYDTIIEIMPKNFYKNRNWDKEIILILL